MGLADERMYTDKRGGRASGPAQITAVLLAALRERGQAEGSAEHHDQVAALAQRVAQGLKLPVEKVDEIVRAAALHDIGKVAVPDAILTKPGPLTEDEWAYIRQHTIIGERILASAPATAPRGGDRPLLTRALRRLGVPRPPRRGPDPAGGADRLRLRCLQRHDRGPGLPPRLQCRAGPRRAQALAGKQFDPAVVEAFAGVLPGRGATRPPKDLDAGNRALAAVLEVGPPAGRHAGDFQT